MPMSAKNQRYYAAKTQWQQQEREWREVEANRKRERELKRPTRTPRNWKFWQTKKEES